MVRSGVLIPSASTHKLLQSLTMPTHGSILRRLHHERTASAITRQDLGEGKEKTSALPMVPTLAVFESLREAMSFLSGFDPGPSALMLLACYLNDILMRIL